MSYQPFQESYPVLESRISYLSAVPDSKMIMGSHNTEAFLNCGKSPIPAINEALKFVKHGHSAVLSLSEHDWSAVSLVSWMTVLPHIDSSQYQRSPVALVVTGDRFRAVALASELISIDPYLSGVSLLVDGGHYPSQLRELDRYGQVVVGTCERILEMAKKRELNLGHLRCLVYEGTEHNISKFSEVVAHINTNPQLLIHTTPNLPIEKSLIGSNGKFGAVKLLGAEVQLVEGTRRKESRADSGRTTRGEKRVGDQRAARPGSNESSRDTKGSSGDNRYLESGRVDKGRKKPLSRKSLISENDEVFQQHDEMPKFEAREVIPEFEVAEVDFDKISHKLLKVKGTEVAAKPAALLELLKENTARVIVFCDTPGELNLLKGYLGRNDLEPVLIDADMPIRVRNEEAAKFLKSAQGVLIVTDLGVRGLNIAGAEMIVNYAIPERSEFYLSRVKAGARRDGECKVVTFWGMIDALKLASLKERLEFELEEI